ncbi:hypothetical protein OA90_00035 [Labrenzia sp. OB1]|nr:hypothetical protein OA90_00035 [Labrenzia sp. OB1]
MRLPVFIVFSVILACFSASGVAQTPSLADLQGTVAEARARAEQARERLARTDARQTAAEAHLRMLIAQNADTSDLEKSIRELEKTQPDLTAIKARFLEEGERHHDKLAKLKAELGPLQQTQPDTSKIDDEIAALKDDIRDFEDYRARAIQELRQGFYCSQCKRPASQIVKETGTSFKQHLRNVNGRPIPMSEKNVAEKKKQFDRQLEQLVNKLKDREDKRDRMINDRKEKIAGLQKAINEEYDDYSAKQTAFDADMAEAKLKHESETRAKIGALKDQVKETWAAHRASIDAKQDDLRTLNDDIYEIRDEIRDIELEEFRAGLKVDHAVFLQRLEMRKKATEIAREKERLRREAQAAFLASLRTEQMRRARAAQMARAREQAASARFRQAVARSRPDWTRTDDTRQPEETARPSTASRVEAPSAEPETVLRPLTNIETQPNEPARPDSPQVQEESQPSTSPEVPQVSQNSEILERLRREQEALERVEKEQREAAEKLARIEAERANTRRVEEASLQEQIDDIAGNGSSFAADAGWQRDMSHPGDGVARERETAGSGEQGIFDKARSSLVEFSTGNGPPSVGAEKEASLWDTVNTRVAEETVAAQNYYRKKLNQAGETLVLELIKSKSTRLSDKVTDAVRSFKDSLSVERFVISRAADVAHDAALRLNYEARTGQSFDDLSVFEQSAERVLAAGRRISTPKVYLERLVSRYETLMNSAERTFLQWRYDDDY